MCRAVACDFDDDGISMDVLLAGAEFEAFVKISGLDTEAVPVLVTTRCVDGLVVQSELPPPAP